MGMTHTTNCCFGPKKQSMEGFMSSNWGFSIGENSSSLQDSREIYFGSCMLPLDFNYNSALGYYTKNQVKVRVTIEEIK